jgi:hypothetical protein
MMVADTDPMAPIPLQMVGWVDGGHLVQHVREGRGLTTSKRKERQRCKKRGERSSWIPIQDLERSKRTTLCFFLWKKIYTEIFFAVRLIFNTDTSKSITGTPKSKRKRLLNLVFLKNTATGVWKSSSCIPYCMAYGAQKFFQTFA